ncbi:DMT family transporter [Salibacterium aidingense]|uniref:DMT family transporter n=1 Tax=Salibacterium aidingense TaxID=384933 RepID=UPI003BDEF087
MRSNQWNKKNTIILSLILFLTVSWGYSWPLMKIGLQYMGPFTFSFLRFLTGGAVLLTGLWLFRKKKTPLSSVPWKQVCLLGFLQTFAVFGLITYAMLFVEAGKTSIILYTMPIWSSILAAIFLNETLTKQNVIGLLFGLCGLSLIVGADVYQHPSLDHLTGIAFILLGSLAWAAANIYFRLKLAGTDSFEVTAYQMLIGTIGLGVLAFLMERGDPVTWTAESIFSVLFTGIAASAICFSIWYFLLRVIHTITAAISTLLVPVFGVIFGYLLLQETLTTFMLGGAAFILIGIFISQTAYHKRK